MATFIPAAIATYGAVKQGVDARDASRYNAAVMAAQAKASSAEGYQQEAQQRRDAREFMGRQAAAIAESGAGTGGTNQISLEQSAVNAELDALNIRYRADLRGKGLLAQAVNERKAGNAAQGSAGLLAGGQLLRGYSNYLAGTEGGFS